MRAPKARAGVLRLLGKGLAACQFESKFTVVRGDLWGKEARFPHHCLSNHTCRLTGNSLELQNINQIMHFIFDFLFKVIYQHKICTQEPEDILNFCNYLTFCWPICLFDQPVETKQSYTFMTPLAAMPTPWSLLWFLTFFSACLRVLRWQMQMFYTQLNQQHSAAICWDVWHERGRNLIESLWGKALWVKCFVSEWLPCWMRRLWALFVSTRTAAFNRRGEKKKLLPEHLWHMNGNLKIAPSEVL